MCGSVGGINIADPLDFSGTRRRKDAAAAERRATQAEEARSARISGNVKDINQAFAGREPQYAQLGDALRTQLNTKLAQQRGQATRQSKFALARSGLTGGSAAVDVGRNLNREATEGTLNAERIAQKGVADLRSQDEQARTQLISLAQSGNDIGNAGMNAANMLRANLSTAGAGDITNNLGEVFASTAGTYRNMQDAAARRRGLQEAQTYGRAFSRS